MARILARIFRTMVLGLLLVITGAVVAALMLDPIPPGAPQTIAVTPPDPELVAIAKADLDDVQPVPYEEGSSEQGLDEYMPVTGEDRSALRNLISKFLPFDFGAPPAGQDQAPLQSGITEFVALENSPFPLKSETGGFLNYRKGEQLAHRTRSGRIYWAEKTYSEKRSLLHIPKGFDIKKPAVMVLFCHGHLATLERDIARRQKLPHQISGSGINAVLVAPQFAKAARDSSPGNFNSPGGVARYLADAAKELARLSGDPANEKIFAQMPVVVIGYSGGHLPTARVLDKGGLGDRVIGVVLLDGLYGQLATFANWIERQENGFFLSAYTRHTAARNETLKKMLSRRSIPYSRELYDRVRPGSVTFLPVNKKHWHYVTQAWTANPVADLLARLAGPAARITKRRSASLSDSR